MTTNTFTPSADYKMAPMPEYTNPAVASAIARCRREADCPLYRVEAVCPSNNVHFAYDLPHHDASMMARSLEFNRYRDVKMYRVR